MSKKLCKYCKKAFSRVDSLKVHKDSGACKLIAGYKYVEKELQKDFDELILDDGKFQILPHLDKRAVISISGASGSGKTCFVNNWLSGVPKDIEIFLFSPIMEDSSFTDKRIKQIPINQELIEDPIKLEQLADSIVLFDDIQSFKQPYKQIVEQLQNDILVTGRHHNVNILNTSHLSTVNGNSFRKDLLNESNAYVIFPASSSKNQTRNLLTNYGNWETKQINKMMSMSTRWVYCYKSYPNYYVTETRIGLVRDL